MFPEQKFLEPLEPRVLSPAAGTQPDAFQPGKFLMAPQPEIFFCAEKAELMDRFAHAIEELAGLHQQLTGAVIRNDPDRPDFESMIEFARRRKNEAKAALLAHAEKHGC